MSMFAMNVQILSCVFLAVMVAVGFTSAEMETAMDQIMKANERLHGVLMEGDIPIIQRGVIDPKYRKFWPNKFIPYTISNRYCSKDKAKIRSAVALIKTAASCLRFREYTSNPPRDHINVSPGSGCWSYIGKIGGSQQLSLAKGCFSSGTIVHEFLHALGFYHEQSRPDRNKFVKIISGNIQSGREHNFKIQEKINTQDTRYDRVSVMHYSKYAFSRNGKPTIVWRANNRLKLGGSALSFYDKVELNRLYCS